MTEALLSWQNVSKSYGTTEALVDVSLALAPGQIVGLLGPNGSGKTTLLSIGCGLDTATSGSVQRPLGEPIGYMPQEYGVYPGITALENLVFFARAWGNRRHAAREAADVALRSVQLDGHAHKRVITLSGGMKRRLSFAAATIGNPNTVLLDEPAAGMDPQSRLVLFDAIRRLRDRGAAVLYSTHYMEEVEAVADEVAILSEGQVLVRDTVEGIIDRHGKPTNDTSGRRASLETAFIALTGRELRDSER